MVKIRFLSWIGMILLAAVPAIAQMPSASSPDSLCHELLTGVCDAYDWTDVPALVLFGAVEGLPDPGRNGRLSLPPVGFEKNLADAVGHPGFQSPGSVNPAIFPVAVFVVRSMYTAGSLLFSNRTVPAREYEHTIVFAKSLFYTGVVTLTAKKWVHRERPDKSETDSFFSGHTSLTFSAATFLQLELNDQLDVWMSGADQSTLRSSLKIGSAVLLYGWASYVGYSRMHDDKHYLLDVAVGAVIGTAVSEILYRSHFGIPGPLLCNVDLSVGPRGACISYTYRF
jgi:hypothetical protein